MHATGGLEGRRGRAFVIEVKPILLPVRCPRFLKGVDLIGGDDPESGERQEHGANTGVRLRAFANMATLRTLGVASQKFSRPPLR